MLEHHHSVDSTGQGATPTPPGAATNSQPLVSSGAEIDLSKVTINEKASTEAARPHISIPDPEAHVRKELTRLLHNSERVPSRQHLFREDIHIKYLFDVLRNAPSAERVGLIRDLMNETAESKKVHRFIECNIPLLLYFTKHDEKVALLNHMLEFPKGKAVIQMCLETMRSCHTLKELNALVKAVGQEKLFEVRNTDLRELVAQAVLGFELRNAGLPKHLSKFSGKRSIPHKLRELQYSLEERIEICKTDPELAKTEFARESIRTARYNLAYMKEERGRLRTVGELKEMTNMLIDKIRLEYKYGLILTNERDAQNKNHRRWTQEDIKQLNSILTRIPEGPLLWTPYLREVCRVERLAEDAFAENDGQRIIKIADKAFSYKDEDAKYKPWSWMAATFCHELGHSFYFGAHYGFAKGEKGTEGYKELFDPRYDYQEYLAISGWKAQRTGFKISDDRQRVTINGESYPLEQVTNVDGKMLSLVHDREAKILYSRSATAEFSAGSYAQSDPWEDWAEAFADYIVKPNRLITFAPKKFAFFEQEFRRYDSNASIINKATKRLFPEEAILKHLSQLSLEQQQTVLNGLEELIAKNK